MTAESATPSPNASERLRLNPAYISEALGDGERTPNRIVEILKDVGQRKELAQELMTKVPQLSEHYADIEALNNRLTLMSEILPQKKTFFENVKSKLGWAFGKVKSVLSHPVVKTVIIALLVWWAWGHLHSLLAGAHGLAGEGALEALEGLDAAPGALNPGMGPGMEAPGGGVIPQIPNIEFELPSTQPPSIPPSGPLT